MTIMITFETFDGCKVYTTDRSQKFARPGGLILAGVLV